MLKIPTFILGGLLILTGLGSYLLQDLGVSIKLSGPLAENAKLTLSDGKESHELDLGYPSSKAAGEQAYWLIDRLNTIHSMEAAQLNFVADQGSDRGKEQSFWYASSKGERLPPSFRMQVTTKMPTNLIFKVSLSNGIRSTRILPL